MEASLADLAGGGQTLGQRQEAEELHRALQASLAAAPPLPSSPAAHTQRHPMSDLPGADTGVGGRGLANENRLVSSGAPDTVRCAALLVRHFSV